MMAGMIRCRLPLLRSTLAILMVLSLTLVLVHWHQEKPGQDCGLCYAHQMSGLHAATGPLLTIPKVSEWRRANSQQILESSAFVPAHPGRAPPKSLSSIFG